MGMGFCFQEAADGNPTYKQNALLHELGKASLQLENKVRFIRELGDGTLVVWNRKKADLCAELKTKGFTPLPKEAVLEASVAGAADHVEGNDETEDGSAEVVVEEVKPVASNTIPGTEYDYLLAMAIRTLTKDKFQQLRKERDTKKAEFDALSNQLDEQDKRDAKDEAERRKQQEKERAKKPTTTSTVVIEPMDTSSNSPTETAIVNVPAPKPRGKAAAQKKAADKNKVR